MNSIKLYTVKEAAKLIGVSTNTLYKYLDDGKIKAARGSSLQGRFRIPEEALEEFLGIKLSTPEAIVEPTPNETTSAAPEASPTRIRTSPRLPTKIARILLFFALLAMLADLFVSSAVSAPTQIIRFIFLTLILVLAYQDGGYRKG